MEVKVESRVGKMPVNTEALYRLFSDFRNMTQFIPKDKLRNFQATEDTCSFEADMVGLVGLKIVQNLYTQLLLRNLEFFQHSLIDLNYFR